MNACLPRSRANLHAILDGFDVEHCAAWLPRDNKTFCNIAAETALEALGTPVPWLLANDEQTWFLGQEAAQLGWTECLLAAAVEHSDAGCPAVVTLHEPGHGHICLLRGRDEHGNTVAWQAGRQNFNSATLRQCFTAEQLTRIRCFIHP